MASSGAKALFLVQLSVLLLSSFTVLADEVDIVSWMQAPHSLPNLPPVEAPKPHKGHHHKKHAPTPAPVKPPAHPPVKPPVHPPVKPPAHPPVKPPAHPPVKPPAHPPVKPPTHPPAKPPSYPVLRKLIAVQGVVYCKSCKYPGIDTLLGATPLAGAVVKLQCHNTKYRPVEAKATTDKNGYFFLTPKNVTTAAFHKCKVFLDSSPSEACNVPTNLHAGSVGAILMPTPKPPVPATPYQIFNVGPFAFEPSKKIPCPR